MNRKKLVFSIIIGIIFIIGIVSFYTTFSLDEEYSFGSDIYSIKDGNILNISPNTDISLFYQYFDLENCTLKVVDWNNHELTSGYVFNQSKTLLYNKDNKVLATYTNIVKGDINSDGMVNQDDLSLFGQYLVGKNSFSLDLDIDGDREVHVNDLILLDKAMNGDYQELDISKEDYLLQSNEEERIVYQVKPIYGKNNNLIWKSLDSNVAVVDSAGRVIGKNPGETKIVLSTLDKKLEKEVKVKVDNTIQLSKKEGIAYVGGDNLEVFIKSVDYHDLTCRSENTEVADCEIQGKKLVIKQKNQGNTNIVVTSKKYGNVTFYLDVMSVYLNVMPKYLCSTPGNVQLITVSAMNSGEYSFAISNYDVVSSAEMQVYNGRNMLRINMGATPGRATLTVKESHGYQSNQITIDTYRISIPAIGGVTTVGKDLETDIIGENLGTLTCMSQDESKATCEIHGKKLIVHPLAIGEVNIKVKNSYSFREESYSCSSADYLAVIREGKE